MAELLATGSTNASSADFTVAAGAKAMLVLKASASGELHPSTSVLLERKDGATVYTVIDKMGYDKPGLTIENTGAGVLTLRVTRVGGFAAGVDQI